ncbi:unnamed protein product [Notodromas monacha]|uniref:Ribosomal RNA-processing protein 43 n=1 Tax=Notodromas monacha TaxID=399045 RepID=A0A7R9BLB8_9CRUS|nr:unnamed protein product [Notodromas monacha]CAG0916750.1 unnamed protein product [Notodromas monacha]
MQLLRTSARCPQEPGYLKKPGRRSGAPSCGDTENHNVPWQRPELIEQRSEKLDEPVKIFLVRRVQKLSGQPFWVKADMRKLKLFEWEDKEVILRNTARVNEILWRVKHLVQIIPVQLPENFQGSPDGCPTYKTQIKDNGVFTVPERLVPSTELEVAEKGLNAMDDGSVELGKVDDGIDISALRKIQPLDFFNKCLEKGLRMDCRKFIERRKLMLEVGGSSTADGFASVKFGDTVAICSIKAEFGKPQGHAPKSGWAIISVETNNVETQGDAGADAEDDMLEEQQVAECWLDDALNLAVDLRDLCIRPNELAWVLYVEIKSVSLDGNFRDVSTLALLLALQNVTLPVVAYNVEKKSIRILNSLVRLPVKRRLFPFTFVVEDSEFLFDPTADEEELSEGKVSVVLDEAGNLCSFESLGLLPSHIEPISRAVEESLKLLPALKTNVEEALEGAGAPVAVPDRVVVGPQSSIGSRDPVALTQVDAAVPDYQEEDVSMYDA